MLFQNGQAQNGWKPSALVIDKDADTHRSIHILLGKEFDVHHAYFPKLAISLLEKRQFNVVITSLDMSDSGDAPQLYQTVEKISDSKGIPVIELTASAPPESSSRRCIGKPLDATLLESALQEALGAYRRRSRTRPGR